MIRVAIADDHAVVRLGLKALLNTASDIVLVGEAADGEALLRLCATEAPHVVVLDISMPGLDGLEVTRRLLRRTDPPKILALTMYAEEEYLIKALEAGVSGYVVKEAASADLLDAIRSVAHGRTWVRPAAARVLAHGWSRRVAEGGLRTAYEQLSEREREVFRWVAAGHTSAQIGDRLHLSPKTIETYRRRVNEKLGIVARSDYVRIALALEILTPGT